MGGVTTDWLSQLAPPHAPPPPGWWPLAPGWWALLILFGVLSAALIYWQTRPDVRLRRIALRELKNLQTTLDDDIALARELEHLLRRYAVARFGRDTVASLSGECWIAFVVEQGGAALLGESGANLLRIAYGGEAAADRTAWLTGAQAFIKGRA
jgi:hypothetical protein